MLLKKNKLFWQNTQLWDISLILYSIPHGCKTFAIVSFLQYHYPKCIVLHQSWFAKSAIDGWWSGFSIHLRHPEKIRRHGNSVLVKCLLRNKFLACWQVTTWDFTKNEILLLYVFWINYFKYLCFGTVFYFKSSTYCVN